MLSLHSPNQCLNIPQYLTNHIFGASEQTNKFCSEAQFVSFHLGIVTLLEYAWQKRSMSTLTGRLPQLAFDAGNC